MVSEARIAPGQTLRPQNRPAIYSRLHADHAARLDKLQRVQEAAEAQQVERARALAGTTTRSAPEAEIEQATARLYQEAEMRRKRLVDRQQQHQLMLQRQQEQLLQQQQRLELEAEEEERRQVALNRTREAERERERQWQREKELSHVEEDERLGERERREVERRRFELHERECAERELAVPQPRLVPHQGASLIGRSLVAEEERRLAPASPSLAGVAASAEQPRARQLARGGGGGGVFGQQQRQSRSPKPTASRETIGVNRSPLRSSSRDTKGMSRSPLRSSSSMLNRTPTPQLTRRSTASTGRLHHEPGGRPHHDEVLTPQQITPRSVPDGGSDTRITPRGGDHGGAVRPGSVGGGERGFDRLYYDACRREEGRRMRQDRREKEELDRLQAESVHANATRRKWGRDDVNGVFDRLNQSHGTPRSTGATTPPTGRDVSPVGGSLSVPPSGANLSIPPSPSSVTVPSSARQALAAAHSFSTSGVDLASKVEDWKAKNRLGSTSLRLTTPGRMRRFRGGDELGGSLDCRSFPRPLDDDDDP
eukprot:NODE_2260_length_2255_cov_4.286184.p1 GENE.NODE_2260_length_2255_cov_4.286184~~NODE_2260_length_2255_cov_4.286184.p1  ORF type:complete len:540 (-),score=164.46 NODE_2260_length_2255_cov_4.286184:511-2130(-)